MKTFISIFLALLVTYTCSAQENYDTDLIPTALRARANAVIRNQQTTVDMQSPNNVMLSVKMAITILNENGEDNARLVLLYDKNTSIKSIKGEVYNQSGISIGKFTQNDFKDESAVHDFSLFEDSRVKHYLPAVNVYPYTIVYTYEVRNKQNLIIPDWIPKPSNDVSVENSTYTFICKPTDKFRIKVQQIANKAEESSNDKQKTITWNVKQLGSQKEEAYGPSWETYFPMVKIAPEQFTYYNYKGSYTSWEELGKWSYDNLLKGRDILPEATIQTIKALVKDEKTDKEKARKIYQYLQNKTRYISVQVGIGGLQPIMAADVDRLGYGDCKALVNYMQSLLSVVGIESYYCVVQAGSIKKDLDPSYASMQQGNHIILCLPLNGDTTWLECTSQKIPFGFLGDFTDDRYVLAWTKDGGKLLKTPKLAAKTNIQLRQAELTLDAQGNVRGNIQTTFTGAQYDNHEHIIGKPLNIQEKLLKEVYAIDNINFDSINYTQQQTTEPTTIEKLSVQLPKYVPLNNGKFFLPVNAFNIKTAVSESKNRLLPLYINRGFTDIDTIVYHLPSEIMDNLIPSYKRIENQFGSYMASAKLLGDKLIYTRKLTVNEGHFTKNDYSEFFNFMREVNENDRLKLVLSLKK